ncbi:MAG: ferric reductase-like transmembrane domain-containing protein [Proteobacteria bacterium]|nr:ferric reductase-like transmembrane domain-containing protein [Pseudomonadota bacterium]
MQEQTRRFGFLSLTLIFIGVRMLIYAAGDFPRRTYLKESISILTLVAFCQMFAQFFIARSTNALLSDCRLSTVLKIHKAIGYMFITVLLVHPVLIVVPRYFESGVDSMEAFLIIITSFDSLGVVLGIISWSLMLVFVVTSLWRNKLPLTYKTWRTIHGFLSIAFISMASWHAINLGRHTDHILSSYIIAMLASCVLMLLKSYVVKSPLTAEIMK